MLTLPTTVLTGGLGSRSQGLEIWLPFDETSGAQKELSGNSYPTIIDGATQGIAAGNLGLSVDFDGVNDNVSLNNAGLLAKFDGSVNHAISFWAAAGAYGVDETAFGIGLDDSADNLAIYPYYAAGMGAEEIWVWYDGGYIFQITNTLAADGTFNHFCLVQRSATDHELYINGVSVGTDSTSKTIAASVEHITIGAYDPTNNEPYDGQITIPKLWSRALTDAEIIEDFKRGQ